MRGEVMVITTKAPPAWVRALGPAFELLYFSIVPRQELRRTEWMKNTIVTSSARGLSIVLDRLTSINTYSLNITHAALGDDNTAASPADTALGNELARASTGTTSRSGTQATLRFFFPDGTTPDDTYEEFGTFIDGTATLDSGRLWNRLILSTPLVKSTGEDNTIVCRFTGSV